VHGSRPGRVAARPTALLRAGRLGTIRAGAQHLLSPGDPEPAAGCGHLVVALAVQDPGSRTVTLLLLAALVSSDSTDQELVG